MNNVMRIKPLVKPPDASVVVPGSKSITNRALVCAALADGSTLLDGALAADDTEAMIECLEKLGASVSVDRELRRVQLEGTGGRVRSGPIELDARLSGTTARFVMPLLTLGHGRYRLNGSAPLRARPMGDGIAAVRALGAEVVEVGEVGHLPVEVMPGSFTASTLQVRGEISSQFLSGLLMVAPCLPDEMNLEVDGHLVSGPYIDMTVAVMKSFGARVEGTPSGGFIVAPTGYRSSNFKIEPDASAASYFFAAAAITGGRVRIDGLGHSSVQGDLRFVNVLREMGAEVTCGSSFTEVHGTGRLRGIDVDLADLSDTAQTLAVAAVFADGPTVIRGIGFIRHKETDRIHAMVTELRRCGIDAEETSDGLIIRPGSPMGCLIQTYEDHRMAMSFSLLGLRVPGIMINDPGCVAKTFPDYFKVLESLGN